MRRRLASAAVSLLAAACIHVAPRPIDPAATARELERRSLAAPEMQTFVAAHSSATPPITRWDVDTLTLAAFYFHPDLDVARAQAAVARAAVGTAGERPNPALNLPIEHHDDVHPWVIVPNVDVTIETANKRGLRVRQATDAARAADIAIAQQAWQLRSAIRTQLAALTGARAELEILERERAKESDLVEALQKRFELGEASTTEVAQARISERKTELLRLDRTSQIAQAHARLATAVGIPESGLGDAELTFDAALPADLPADLRERALRARPDVLMALADYAAAESALRVELARQYPDLHISPGFGWDAGLRRWDLGLSSMLPVLSRNRGAIAEAVARRTLSEKNFVALQARIIGELDVATATYRQALRAASETAAVVAAEREQLATVEKSFRAGETDRVALRVVEMELASAELAHADAVAQAHAALGMLEDAVEQPLTGAPMPAVPETPVRGEQ